jgi:DNA-binding winged helix-turn-helix (wHTH) protein/tetratricopeptide (TPR) repeat protein
MIYRFDDFEIDTLRFELRRNGLLCTVEPQVYSLLLLLVENRHRMVSREEIIDSVWMGRSVSDSALSSRVKDARKALKDDGVSQRFIRTVHGRGFRFIGEVTVIDDRISINQSKSGIEEPVASVLSRPVLAVFPIENDGGDTTDGYLLDGITEELIIELSSWRWFPVLSRNSSFDRTKAHLPASSRALSLGARYALTGRLVRSASDARLSVELLDAASDTLLWSECFTAKTNDLFSLHERVAAGVFNKVAPELTSAETRRVLQKRSDDLTAWDLAFKGLWHLHRSTPSDFSVSLNFLDQAIQADPGFALPWSLIALVRFEIALKGFASGTSASIRDLLRDMLLAAKTSIDLDPAGWMGHSLMSVGELWTNFDLPKAHFHANRALELNPSSSMAHHFLGCIQGFSGDLEAAIKTQNTVYLVDPSYTHLDVIEADLGLWNILRNDLDGAKVHLRQALTLNPRNVRALQRLLVLGGILGDRNSIQTANHRLHELGSAISETDLVASYPFQNQEHSETFRMGLRKARI